MYLRCDAKNTHGKGQSLWLARMATREIMTWNHAHTCPNAVHCRIRDTGPGVELNHPGQPKLIAGISTTHPTNPTGPLGSTAYPSVEALSQDTLGISTDPSSSRWPHTLAVAVTDSCMFVDHVDLLQSVAWIYVQTYIYIYIHVYIYVYIYIHTYTYIMTAIECL